MGAANDAVEDGVGLAEGVTVGDADLVGVTVEVRDLVGVRVGVGELEGGGMVML